jgi:4-hydroxybenzoate polyprenyltransferase
LWVYTVGSFAIGIVFADEHVTAVHALPIFIMGVWLTIPANVFLYALNDAYDIDADHQNPRKGGIETALAANQKQFSLRAAAGAAVSFLVPALFVSSSVVGILVVCCVLAITYNIPPFRFKGRPILDCLLAVVYPACGLAGYVLVTHSFPPANVLLTIVAFACAMHVYSAAVDRDADKLAGLHTSAVALPSAAVAMIGAALLFIGCAVMVSSMSYLVAAILAMYAVWCVGHAYSLSRYPHASALIYERFVWVHVVAGTVISWAFL